MHNWIPQPRESASLLFRPNENLMWLFGGICQEPMTSMATFEINPRSGRARYQQLERSTQTGLERVNGVFGLGSCCYQRKFYYFFGGLGFNRNLKVRLCTAQVIEFNPETRNFDQINLWHKPDRLLAERRYMTTLLVGQKFLCFGGINKQGYALKELLSIDMETKQWVEMQTKGDHPGHLQSSAMCLVAYQERKTLRLDRLSEIKWHLVTEKIALEGIFVFGGIKGEVPDMKLKDNNLYRLSIGEKQHVWSIV